MLQRVDLMFHHFIREVFLPHLNYSILLWGSETESIHKVQKRVLRIISTTSKVFENVILYRLRKYLWTTDNQFGFKAGHSTDLCVYALTEFIEYLKRRSTSVYVAFLDASNAFDKINH